MKVDVLNIKGEATSRKVDLDNAIFRIQPNDHAIYLDVKRIRASQHQGTHKAKERADIKGSTKKLRKQKGIGAARVGSIKNPLFRGGGRVFGPRPKSYDIKINKKVRVLARKSALSYKVSDKKLIVLENFSFEAPKTRDYVELLSNLKLEGVKNMLVIPGEEQNVILSGRNVHNAYICTPEKLNTYDILNNEILILTESSVDIISKILN